eukprot:TRINITY_DN5217_c0_g1_i1.p1 TRINITY_DN5217_c0_g1~~TRINITY_DN5217_c0_g1_i1.p1  ORF type:complete len:143 (+),score=6.22 TRINITY_DN5217_c0_g1_i1:80-508(+)
MGCVASRKDEEGVTEGESNRGNDLANPLRPASKKTTSGRLLTSQGNRGDTAQSVTFDVSTTRSRVDIWLTDVEANRYFFPNYPPTDSPASDSHNQLFQLELSGRSRIEEEEVEANSQMDTIRSNKAEFGDTQPSISRRSDFF